MKQADEVPLIGNIDYQEALVKARVQAENERVNQQLEADRAKIRELDKIAYNIEKAFERGRLLDNCVVFDMRLKHVSESDVRCLNTGLSSKGIKITSVSFVKGEYENHSDVDACLCTSCICCCLPLLYWLPKFWIRDKYGLMHTITIEFDSILPL